MWELPPLSCETQETFQRQRAGTSVGEKRAAVTACDSQRLSRELAATAVPDTPPGGDAGAIWRGGGGEMTKSRPAAAGSSRRETVALRFLMLKAKERGLPATQPFASSLFR